MCPASLSRMFSHLMDIFVGFCGPDLPVSHIKMTIFVQKSPASSRELTKDVFVHKDRVPVCSFGQGLENGQCP